MYASLYLLGDPNRDGQITGASSRGPRRMRGCVAIVTDAPLPQRQIANRSGVTDICMGSQPYSNGADMRRIFVALSIALSCGGAAHALDREQRHARALLEEFCGRCHAIGRTGQSSQPYAPPFRELG